MERGNMKRFFLSALLILLTAGLWAEYPTYGAGLEAYLYNITDVTMDGYKARDLSLELTPSFSIMKSELREYVPFAVFAIETEKDGDSLLERYVTFGGGFDVNFHLFRTQHFRFATGVSTGLDTRWAVTDPTYDLDVTLALSAAWPLMVEINPTEFLSLRATMDVLRLDLSYRWYDTGSGVQKRFRTSYDVIVPFTEMKIGVYYRFETKKSKVRRQVLLSEESKS